MKKLVWAVSIALVVLGPFTGVERASAANGYQEWTMPQVTAAATPGMDVPLQMPYVFFPQWIRFLSPR